MRRGTRRGQSIADYLRIAIPGNVTIHDVESPKIASPDTPKSVSPSSTTTSTSSSKETKTKSDSPSPTTTTFSSTSTSTSSTSSTTTSSATTTTSISSVATTSSSLSLILNHPSLATTTANPATTSVALNPTAPDSTRVVTSWTTLWVADEKTRSAAGAKDATSTTVIAAAESASAVPDGLGPMQFMSNGHLHLDGAGVAGIAVGSSAGTIIIAVLLFILYRKWNKRRNETDGDGEEVAGSPAGGVKEYLSRRFTHKSDDRIMNELMTAAYSAENSGGQQEYLGFGGGDEKQRVNRQEDEMPILPRGPAPVATKPRFKRTPRVSRWLGRQNDDEMLNPMEARASFVSNATGLRTLDLRSMSGWGSDDGMSEYTGYTIPPRRPAQQQPQQPQQPQQQEQAAPARRPTTQSSDGMPRSTPDLSSRNTLDRQFDDVQELVVRMGESDPPATERFPSPEELMLPAPPTRPPSIAARTEVTGRSSGSWNTWGVMQHRDQPKGWKDKLGDKLGM